MEMLREIGVDNLDELISKTIPDKARFSGHLSLEKPKSELEVTKELEELSKMNSPEKGLKSFLGAGVYDHFIPSVVDAVTSRPEFFTSYTPYQAEASQGTLAAIFEFQTIIAELTGMDVANASMYDGATALAEAVLMARRLSKSQFPGKVLILEPVHPAYVEVTKSYTEPHGIELVTKNHINGIPTLDELPDSSDFFALVIQQPTFFGTIHDYTDIIRKAKESGILTIVVHDPHLLSILEPPGTIGADICVGEAQSFGNPLNFGGPLLGYFATKKEHLRQMPGRIVGETVDADGNRAFVMTLQTREQHIRRERATSNICTNEALCALAATVYASWYGPEGLKELAKTILLKTDYASNLLGNLRSIPFRGPFFKDFVVALKNDAEKVVTDSIEKGVIPGIPLKYILKDADSNLLMVSVTEKNTREDIELLAKIIEEVDR